MKTIDNWPWDTIVPTEDEAIYDVLVAIENTLDRLDVQADELMQQRFLETATTHELEKLGGEVGVIRETGEPEERYRFRARLGKAISSSDGTTPSFEQILRLVFEDDVENVSIEPVDAEPVTRVRAPSSKLDELPVSNATLTEILSDAVPASDGVEIVSEDTFILGESGSQGLGEGELV